MKKQKFECRCIRCREIGHKFLKQKIEINEDNINLNCDYYECSGGEEVFVTLIEEKHDAMIGYLRLRNIVNPHRHELQKNPCMILRELKVVGRELSIGKRSKEAFQHKGYGKELINEAERICLEEYDKKHLFVLSGKGVKDYYRKLRFKNNGVYLSKTL